MKSKISLRDIFFFFMGLMTFLVIELIWDWDNNVMAFKEGMDGARESTAIENKN